MNKGSFFSHAYREDFVGGDKTNFNTLYASKPKTYFGEVYAYKKEAIVIHTRNRVKTLILF